MGTKPRTTRSKNRKDLDEFALVYIGHCRFCGKKFYFEKIGTKDCSLKCHGQYTGWHRKHPREDELLELGIPLKKDWQLEAAYKLIKFLGEPLFHNPEYLRRTYGHQKLLQALRMLDYPLLFDKCKSCPELPLSILIDPEFVSDDIRIKYRKERYGIVDK